MSEVYLRTIEMMLASIDKRIPDDSLAPKPYEVTAAEMRDLVRLSRGKPPLTKEGRAALAQANLEGRING
jgi:hypothetical protein